MFEDNDDIDMDAIYGPGPDKEWKPNQDKREPGGKTEPDFEAMWEKIKLRIDYPLYYFIEHSILKQWLSKDPGVNGKYYLTNNPYKAMRFQGKDARAIARIYLWLEQDAGNLKNFEVTEHQDG